MTDQTKIVSKCCHAPVYYLNQLCSECDRICDLEEDKVNDFYGKGQYDEGGYEDLKQKKENKELNDKINKIHQDQTKSFDIEKIAMNIVYQIGDELKTPVEIRQATNDKCIDFVKKLLNQTLQEQREQIGWREHDISSWINYGKSRKYFNYISEHNIDIK